MRVTEGPPLVVLIEQFCLVNSGLRELITPMAPASTLEEARAIAQHLAWTHRPQQPRSERKRSVFEGLDGSWLVNVEGRTTTFHFKVIIARWHGDGPRR